MFSKGPFSRNNQERRLIIKAAFLIFLDLGHFENTVRSSVGQRLRIRRPILDTFNSFSAVPLTTVCSGALSLSGAARGQPGICGVRNGYAEAMRKPHWSCQPDGELFLGMSGACHDRTPLFPFAPSNFFVLLYNPKTQKQLISTDTCTFNNF